MAIQTFMLAEQIPNFSLNDLVLFLPLAVMSTAKKKGEHGLSYEGDLNAFHRGKQKSNKPVYEWLSKD